MSTRCQTSPAEPLADGGDCARDTGDDDDERARLLQRRQHPAVAEAEAAFTTARV
jgi:hypothetical protein